jgi:CRP-like cAMP-binding protein
MFVEGDRSDFVALIDTGRVKITNTSANGHTCLLAFRGPGDLIGEFGALDGRPRSATVTPVGDVTAIVLSAVRFRRVLQMYPAVTFELLRTVVDRVREADRRRLEYGAYEATERIMRVLLDLALQHGLSVDGDSRARMLVGHQHDLAAATNTSRESVARTLRRLIQLGMVTTRRGAIVVTDVDVLAELVG